MPDDQTPSRAHDQDRSDNSRPDGADGGGTPENRGADGKADGAPGKKAPKRKRGGESLEDRILFSGTWADVDTGEMIDGPTDGADAFVGTDADEIVSGLDGSDDLFGGGGADTLSGDAGDDGLFGGAGDDVLDGGAGDDTLSGDAGDDILDGGDGDDALAGGDGADTLRGGAGADTLEGGAGDDNLSGGVGSDTLDGGDGNDTIVTGGGSDAATGGGGDDVFTVAGAQAGDVLTIDGGAGQDRLDLSAYSSDAVTFSDGSLEISTGDGSFTVNYTEIESISFADADASFLDGDASGSVSGGTDILIRDGEAVSIGVDGPGSVSWSFDADSGELTIDGTAGTTADSTLVVDDLGTDGLTPASVRIDTDLGELRSDADLASVEIDHAASLDAITVGDGSGSIGTLSFAGGDVGAGSFVVNADVGTLEVGRLEADVTINGDLGSLAVSGGADADLAGSLTVTGDLGSVTLADGLDGTLSVGGDLGSLDAASIAGDLSVGDDLGSLRVAGDVGGSVSVVDNAGAIEVGGGLVGDLTVGDGLASLSVARDADGAVSVGGDSGAIAVGGALGGDVSVGGDLASLGVTGDATGGVSVGAGSGAITVGGGLVGDLTVGDGLASLSVAGDADGAVSVGGDSGAIAVGGALGGGVSVGGDLASLGVTGDATGAVSVGAGSGAITVGGALAGDLAVGEDLASLSAGRATGAIVVGGDAGAVSIDGLGDDSDLEGDLTVGGSLESLTVGNDIESTVRVTGDAGTISAGDRMKGEGEIVVGGNAGTISAVDDIGIDVRVGGSLTLLEAEHVEADISIDGNAGTIRTTGGAGDNDLGGDLTVGGDLGTLEIAGDTEGAIAIGGNAGTLSAGGGFVGVGPVTVGGNLTSMTAGDTVSVDVSVEGDIGSITAPTMTGDLFVGDDLSNLNVSDMQGTITGGSDHNSLRTTDSSETISTGRGNDRVYAGGGDDDIDLGSGNDWVEGGAGDDTIDGGDGTDTVSYGDIQGGGVDIDLEAGTATGAGGADTITDFENAQGTDSDDTISGTDGRNTLEGRGGDDTIAAGDGDDTVRGGAGDDTMDGGAGTDSLSYTDIGGGGVDVDMNAGTATGAGGSDTFTGFENVYGSNQDDTIVGDGGDNLIDGERGDDVIDAGAGDDHVYGGLGDDTLDGGEGNDWLRYNEIRGDGIDVDLRDGTVTGSGGNDTVSNFENIYGSHGDDTLQGDDGDNVIQGYHGDDTIRGGLGDDTLDGDGGTDTVSYSDITGGGVDVNLADGTATGAGGSDTLRDFENAEGTDQDDTLTGDGSDNVLTGLAGDDTIDAGGGNDTVYAGEGDDTIDGGAGNDRIFYGEGADTVFGGAGDDTIDDAAGTTVNTTGVMIDAGAGNDSVWGGDGDDTILGGTGNDRLQGHGGDDQLEGGEGNDRLQGDEGNDTLDGGAGDDTLIAGSGDDTLIGGAGTDTADYRSSGAAIEVDLVGGTVTSAAGNDTFESVEGFVGSSHDDTFLLTGASGGERFTIDGGGGTNTLDLGEYGRDDVVMTRSGDSVVVTLPSGGTATIDFTNIDRVILSDAEFDPTDPPPDAVPAQATMNEDGSMTTGALIDTEALDSGRAYIERIEQPEHGTLVLNDDGSFTYTPDPDYAGHDSFSYTIDDVTGDTTATVTLEITPDADTPITVVSDTAGAEDNAIPLDLSGSITDTDGSESLTFTVSDMPEGATLSAGVDNGDGSWTLTPGDLDGLTITPPEDFSGEFELSVTITATDTAVSEVEFRDDTISSYGGSQDAGGSVAITEGGAGLSISGNSWKDIPFPVTITEDTVLEFEFRSDGQAEVQGIGFDTGEDISSNRLFQLHGSQDWGVRPAEGYAGDGAWQTFRIPVGEFYTGDFETMTFAHDNDAHADATSHFRNIRVTHGGDQATSEPQSLTVSVEAVADEAALSAGDVSGAEDRAIALDIASSLNDTDGSETLSVTVSGVPSGASLSAGVDNGDGSWTLSPEQLDGLAVTPPSDFSGEFELSVTATTTDGVSTATVSDSFTVSVEGVADEAVLSAGDVSGFEDRTIALDLSSAFADTDGSETMSITVSDLPEGASLSAGIDNGDGSWTLTPGQLDGLTVTPPTDFSGEFELSVSATTAEGDSTATVTDSFTVSVSGVADEAILNAGDVSGFEDGPIALDIAASIADLDGSESLSVTVSGVPSGASLSAGTDNGDGSWTLSPDQLDGLTITPPADYSGEFELSVSATTTEGDTASTVTDSFTVSVSGIADDATLTVGDVEGFEDQPIALDIASALTDTDGSETLSVTVSGVPSGASLSAGIDNGDGSWTLSPEQLDGLAITPPADFSGEFDLAVVATTTDGVSTATVSDSLTVSVAGVADDASLSVVDVSGVEDGPIALDISSALTDTDGSETLSVTVSGVPAGASLSAGVDNGDGSWTLHPDQLGGLSITPPANFSGEFDLAVAATTTDGVDTATVTDSLTVSVSGVADEASLTVADAAGFEDGPIALDISSVLTDGDGSETLSVTVSGVPSGASLSAGVDNGDGSWTLRPDQLDGLSITPPADFSGEFDLTVAATTVEGDTAATVSDSLRVTVAGVADDATLSVGDASGFEDEPIALDIASALNDTDGSETLSVTVSGVPSGASLSAGVDNGDGSWTLSPEQLDGLTITPPADFSGEFDLSVAATTTDGVDTATVTDSLTVSVAGVADEGVLSAADVSGVEDRPIALDLQAGLSDTDGSETLSITVANLPEGASLSAGVDNGDGSWTLTPDQLEGLELTPPRNFSGDFEVSVTATTAEGDTTATVADSFTVSVRAVVDTASLEAADVSGFEDQPIALELSAARTDASASIEIVVSGVPEGASLSAGVDNGDGSWTLRPAELDGLELTPPANYSGEFELEIAATTSEDGRDITVSESFTVSVAGVSDGVAIAAPSDIDALTGEDTPLGVSARGFDHDGSETVVFTVRGLPENVTLTAGTPNPDGSWTLTPEQLEGVGIDTSAGYAGSFELTITGTATEADGDAASSTETIRVHITPPVDTTPEAPEPAIPAPAGEIDWGDEVELGVIDTVSEIDRALEEIDDQVQQLDLPSGDPDSAGEPLGYTPIAEVPPMQSVEVDESPVPPPSDPLFEFSQDTNPGRPTAETAGRITVPGREVEQVEAPADEDPVETVGNQFGRSFAFLWGLVRSIGGRPADGKTTDSDQPRKP